MADSTEPKMDVEVDSKKRKAEDQLESEPATKKAKTAEASAEDQTKPAPSELPEDEGQRQLLAKNIKTQIEFYFSDSNYPTDKHLRTIADSDNGCTHGLLLAIHFNPPFLLLVVPVAHLATFSRIARHTNNLPFITQAIADSEVFAWNEDKSKIKRIAPLPSVALVDGRSIVVVRICPTQLFALRLRCDSRLAFLLETSQRLALNKSRVSSTALMARFCLAVSLEIRIRSLKDLLLSNLPRKRRRRKSQKQLKLIGTVAS